VIARQLGIEIGWVRHLISSDLQGTSCSRHAPSAAGHRVEAAAAIGEAPTP